MLKMSNQQNISLETIKAKLAETAIKRTRQEGTLRRRAKSENDYGLRYLTRQLKGNHHGYYSTNHRP
jgi:ribosomal protein S6